MSIQKIADSLPYVFHGETLRGFDGGTRVPLPPSKHWVPKRGVAHFEGIESKPKRCQFRRLWTAFHTFSMEKHYEALMVEAGPYFHHQSIGYQGAVSHILKGWRRSPHSVNSAIAAAVSTYKRRLTHLIREFATNGFCVCLFHLSFLRQAQ